MKTKMTMLEALQTVVSYQGLESELQSWKELEPNEHGDILPNYWEKWKREDTEVCFQLQIFWMICVCLFGDWGISPRFAWIEDRESFKTFIDLVTRCRDGDDDIESIVKSEEEYEQLIQHVDYTAEIEHVEYTPEAMGYGK